MIIPALILIKEISCKVIDDLSQITNKLKTIWDCLCEFSQITVDSQLLLNDPDFLGESDDNYNDNDLSD